MHFGSFMQTPSPNPLKGLRYLKVVVGGFQGPMGGGSDVLVSQREAASDKRLSLDLRTGRTLDVKALT